MSDYHFFWNGPLSQWHWSPFELDGIEYSCAEQYMMAEKARLFGDDDTLAMIMQAEEPSVQKRLGRVVDGFDRDIWEEEEDNGMPRCWNIVHRGNLAKFTQNPELAQILRETAPAYIVEASPEDCIWGVGLAEDDPAIQDSSNWRGTNWLGEVLTDVRELLPD
ncbi:MAG: NADAR family protein [Myxococcota bacterium]